MTAVAFGWLAFPQGFEMRHRFALFRQLQPQLPARLCLTVERLRNCRRAARLAEGQDLHLKVAAVVLHLQQVADPDLTRSLGWLSVGLNPAELTYPCSERARLEESGGPEPLVHSHAGHDAISQPLASGVPELPATRHGYKGEKPVRHHARLHLALHKPMKIQLDHIQRLNLHALLGAQRGDVATIRALWALQDKLALSTEEETAVEIKREFASGQERVAWNPQRSLPAKAFEFTDAEAARLRAALETWPAYGAAADRCWLEPLLRMIEPATFGRVESQAPLPQQRS